MKFKLLAGALVLIPIVLAVWWWLAAGAHITAVNAWLEGRRAIGWQAEARDVVVNGFPNRLDLRLDAPALADPASGWAWSAERLDILQVIYAPTFFVIQWPAEQQIAAPGARAVLRNAEMEASLMVRAATSLDLIRASFDLQDAAIAAEAGWTASVQRLTFHVREAPDAGPDNAYEFRLDALRLRLPEFLRRIADPAGALPADIEAVTAEGRGAFDKTLDREAAEGAKPQLVALSLSEATARWGNLSLSVSGAMKADAAGYAEGEFDLAAVNWREMLDAAVATGALNARLAETLKTGLGLIARLSGDPSRLNIGITMQGGLMRIGPIPIGPAPKLLR